MFNWIISFASFLEVYKYSKFLFFLVKGEKEESLLYLEFYSSYLILFSYQSPFSFQKENLQLSLLPHLSFTHFSIDIYHINVVPNAHSKIINIK